MVYCRHCGKMMEDSANYCSYCGVIARCTSMPPPVIPYSPPQDRNVLVIVAVVVVVVFVLPIILSAVMYAPVMGVPQGSQPTPVANLTLEISDEVLTVTVLDVSHRTSLDDVWIDLRAGQEEGGMNAGEGTFSGLGYSQGSFGDTLLTYLDLDGDKCLSRDDRPLIAPRSGPMDSGLYSLILRFNPNWMVIGHIETTVP